jgi:hypothetical protein
MNGCTGASSSSLSLLHAPPVVKGRCIEIGERRCGRSLPNVPVEIASRWRAGHKSVAFCPAQDPPLPDPARKSLFIFSLSLSWRARFPVYYSYSYSRLLVCISHSAPARPPGPLSHIHRSILDSQCGAGTECIVQQCPVWCSPLADRSTALHGRTANSLLSHGSRILLTPRGVHTLTYVAHRMGRLAV